MANFWENDEVVEDKKKLAVPDFMAGDEVVDALKATPQSASASVSPLGMKKSKADEYMLLPIREDDDGTKHFDSDVGLLGALRRSFMLPGDVMAGKVDPTSEAGIERATEFAGTFGMPSMRLPRAPVTEAVEPAATRSVSPLRNLLVGAADDPAVVRQRVSDLQAVGIDNPTAGMVSGSNRAMLREQALAPTSRSIQEAQTLSQTAVPESITSLADRMASSTNPAARSMSKSELSQALIDQAETVKAAQVTKANELYSKVGELTGNSPAVGDSSRAALAALKETKANLSNSAKLTEGPQLNTAIKHAEAIVKDIDGGATFQTLKEARTALGAMTNDYTLNPTLKTHLNALRNAIGEDMGATARATGDEAYSAWKSADDFYKTHKDTETGFGKKSDASQLLNKNADNAYDFLLGKSKEGAQRIRNLKGQITQEGGQETWDRTKGTILMRTATDTNGNVSGSTYLKNFRQFAPEAKDEIWGPVGTAERDQMETIARAAETLKGYAAKANHSNTENHRSVLADLVPGRDSLLWAAIGGPKAFLAAAGVKGLNAGGKWYQAKLLTDPATREWLAGVPSAGLKKGGISGHVGRLLDIERTTGDPATRSAIAEYLRAAGYEQPE